VAEREMKMPKRKINREPEEEAIPPQNRRPESGRYLLQIDRQTKASFQTLDEAQSVALEIKKSYPVIQVAIYDSVDHSRTLISIPTTR
jgi:hypothetical protein